MIYYFPDRDTPIHVLMTEDLLIIFGDISAPDDGSRSVPLRLADALSHFALQNMTVVEKEHVGGISEAG